MWKIQFMKTATGMMVYSESKVDPDEIAEYGMNVTTGILISDNTKIARTDEYPELYAAAEAAVAISDKSERFAAWQEVDQKANRIAKQINRQEFSARLHR